MARATLLSALVYTAASLAAGGVFLAITISSGEYGWVARLGGAGWVFFLSMIILMPVVIPWMKRRTS
jgi:hypothetical protein